MTSHEMFDGRVQVYKRGGRFWQCAARIEGQRFRESTKEESLELAKQVAEDWYLELRGKLRAGLIKKKEHTFASAADEYLREMKVLTVGVRSPKYIAYMELRLNKHILPFFASKGLSEVTRGLVQSYRVKRAEETIERTGKQPARSTMQQEIVHIRQILKFAEGRGWIPFVPSLSADHMRQTKKGRRAWFSPEEYNQLVNATRRRITEGKRPGYRPKYEQMHDFVLFAANTGLRPDESWNLEFRDVSVEHDHATNKTILVIDVRGKTGVGYCKSTDKAVFPFERGRERRIKALRKAHPEASQRELEALLAKEKVFPTFERAMFNAILDEEGLKLDRDGQRRTAYSLRHTYICMRLMEGAPIHMLANNCRTSPQMIEEHYAAHIKDRLDASLLNVQRPKRLKRPSQSDRSDTAPM